MALFLFPTGFLPGHFMCDNGVQVRNELVCDGVDNCFDNSDERNCAESGGRRW